MNVAPGKLSRRAVSCDDQAMKSASQKMIGMIGYIAAGIGVLAVVVGIVASNTGNGGGAAVAAGIGFLGFALLLYIMWLAVDAITDGLDEVRAAIEDRDALDE